MAAGSTALWRCTHQLKERSRFKPALQARMQTPVWDTRDHRDGFNVEA
jgi:hypothetical protein